MAGCSTWEGSAPSETSALNNKEILKNIDENNEQLYELLEKTFSDQRIFLNNTTEWPVLLTKAGAAWHFKKITGVELDTISSSFKDKAATIIEYGSGLKLLQDEEADKAILCLLVYSRHFKESLEKFLVKIEVSILSVLS